MIEPYLEGTSRVDLERLLAEALEEELGREEDLGEIRARIHDLRHAIDQTPHDVRAITVKQPWAWAIAHGGKTIENRSRGTKFRGLLLIHAGAAWSDRGSSDPRVLRALATFPADSPTTRSAIIAVAELVDSHPDAGCCRPWGESQYSEASGRTRTDVHHLVLANVLALPDPVPATGALGLWRPTPDLLATVNRKVLPS